MAGESAIHIKGLIETVHRRPCRIEPPNNSQECCAFRLFLQLVEISRVGVIPMQRANTFRRIEYLDHSQSGRRDIIKQILDMEIDTEYSISLSNGKGEK